MSDPTPPKKSKLAESWKSLAGNLFGVQFDGTDDLDDIDLDSVAEAVEELNPTDETTEQNVSANSDLDDQWDVNLDDEDLSFDEDDDSSVCEQAEQTDAEVSESPQVSSLQHEDDFEDDEIPVSKSYQKSSFEDEDPFGFGLADAEDEDEIEAELEDEPVRQESSADAEVDFDESDFDFESDTDDADDVEEEDLSFSAPVKEPVKKSADSRRSNKRRPSRDENKSRKETEKLQAETSKPAASPEETDDFWNALDDWDGSNTPAPRKSRQKQAEKPSRSSLRDSDEIESVKDEATDAEGFGEEETEDKPRPKRRRKRRRRSSQPRSGEATADEKSEEAQPEVAAEDIDLLWGDEPLEKVEEKLKSSRKRSPRSRGTREPSSSSSNSVPSDNRRPQRSQSPRDSGRNSEESGRSDTDEQSTQRPKVESYKGIPTWVEAMDLIVKKRDPSASGSRSNSGRRGGSRGASRKRPARKREE